MPLVLAPGVVVVRPLSRAIRAGGDCVPPTLIPWVAGGPLIRPPFLVARISRVSDAQEDAGKLAGAAGFPPRTYRHRRILHGKMACRQYPNISLTFRLPPGR